MGKSRSVVPLDRQKQEGAVCTGSAFQTVWGRSAALLAFLFSVTRYQVKPFPSEISYTPFCSPEPLTVCQGGNAVAGQQLELQGKPVQKEGKAEEHLWVEGERTSTMKHKEQTQKTTFDKDH